MKNVLCSIEGGTAYIQLNRPESINALNNALMKDLCECLKEVNGDSNVKIVVLSGVGANFSTGGDIKEIMSTIDEPQFNGIKDTVTDIALAFYSMPKLTIAAIQGIAAGLGLSIALAADFILCETNSKLAMNFIDIGLIPHGGAHFMLEKRIGPIKTKKVIWDGKAMSGTEAAEIGLADRAVASGTIKEEVVHLINELQQKPLEAMIKTKKIIADLNRPQLLKTLELEKYGQLKMRESDDHHEGLRALIEKRKPIFNQ